ncbi:unnamed protein product, partial [marine sediment metagenome]
DPILNREVIYRPREPELPTWVDSSSTYMMELEFIVSAQGEVKEVVPIVSSGNSDVNLLGVRYLKSWRFAPFPLDSTEEQQGRVKFIFGGGDKAP